MKKKPHIKDSRRYRWYGEQDPDDKVRIISNLRRKELKLGEFDDFLEVLQ